MNYPKIEAFRKTYLEKSKEWDYFFLQGHPESWDETRWENFVKVIEFLEQESVRFVTPTELYVLLSYSRHSIDTFSGFFNFAANTAT